MTTMLALLITLILTSSSAVVRDETVLVSEMATLTVKWERGAVSILKVERTPLKSPERLRRWRGRFEARALGSGGKPIDFVRFDFPLMAAAESPDDVTEDAKKLGQKIRENVKATMIVRAPLPPGATAVGVYDTVTRKTVSADLPPAAPGGDGSTKR
jgi:hypothetical protein